MKKLLLFPLIFLLALFSCMRQSRPLDRKLEEIDTLVMRNDNDSALQLLGNIGRKQLETPSDSIFFNLLYVQAATQAADRNVKETDIDKLIEYYDAVGDQEKLMRSYYCKATYLMNNGDLKQALVFAQKAEGMLADFHNVDIENRIFKLFMAINYNSKNYKKALIYGHKILEIGLKSGDYVVVSEVYNNISTVFSERDEIDSAEFLLKRIG